MLDAHAIIQQLGLVPLHGEGGFYRETYRSSLVLPSNSLAPLYTGDRACSTAIYYLLTPDTYSALHRLPGDEMFHFYLGDPVEMLQLHPDGRSQLIRIGCDLAAGLLPQVLVPGGTWQGSRLAPGGRFALMGVTVAPGFSFEDYLPGSRRDLVAQYPHDFAMIAALTSP